MAKDDEDRDAPSETDEDLDELKETLQTLNGALDELNTASTQLGRSLVDLRDDLAMDELNGRLMDLRDRLDDINSAYPSTKAFLETRGLTKVSQLDDQGMQDLRSHLEERLREAREAYRSKLN